jgi:(1->4)-alpha-D-glucan 1-alpha-D-glucosylmutase
MTLLKLTQPGVPDIYQGCEMLDLSLVDPDNRRPVDFAARRAALAALRTLDSKRGALAPSLRALFAPPHDGRAKLWVTMRALALRRAHEALFADDDYRSLAARGARAKHVVAFARTHGRDGVLVVAGRLFASLGLDTGELPLGGAVWADTALDVPFVAPGTALRNVLTGETLAADGRIALAQAFGTFPAALFAYTLMAQ